MQLVVPQIKMELEEDDDDAGHCGGLVRLNRIKVKEQKSKDKYQNN